MPVGYQLHSILLFRPLLGEHLSPEAPQACPEGFYGGDLCKAPTSYLTVIAPNQTSQPEGGTSPPCRARRACIRAEVPADLALAKSKYGPSQKGKPRRGIRAGAVRRIRRIS